MNGIVTKLLTKTKHHLKKNWFFYLLFIVFGILLSVPILLENLQIFGDEPEVAESAINIMGGYKTPIKTLNLHLLSSLLEPYSFLYGSVYSFILATVGIAYTTIFGDDFKSTMQIYTLFRIVNLFIYLFSAIIFGKLVLKTTSSKKMTVLSVLMFLLFPINVARSQFINQDTLGLFFFILVLYVFTNIVLNEFNSDTDSKNLNSLKPISNKRQYLQFALLGVFSGFLVASKITYIVVLISIVLFLIFYLYKQKFTLTNIIYSSILIMGILTIVSYALAFPHSIINYHKYIARVLELRTLEANIAVDSYHPEIWFYVVRILLVFLPLFFALVFIAYKSDLRKNLKKIIKENHYLIGYVFIFLTLITFFSLQERKTDRWGMPLYMMTLLTLINVIYLSISTKVKYYFFYTNIFLLFILSAYVYTYFLHEDPRVQMKHYLQAHATAEDPALLITSFGNNMGADEVDYVTPIRHKVYQKDLETYVPSLVVNPLVPYKYYAIGNNVIQDFYRKSNLESISQIREWKSWIESMPKDNVVIIGARKIYFQPQMGFTVFVKKGN